MSNKKEIDNYEILFLIEAIYPGTRSLRGMFSYL